MKNDIKPQALDDMQGLLLRSYSYLKEASYLLLRIASPEKARKWIEIFCEEVTPASKRPEAIAIHIAFTNYGIKKLIPERCLARKFSREFSEGMVTETRSRILGDVDTNDPRHWEWNGTQDKAVDLMVMIFAIDKNTLTKQYDTISKTLQTHDITIVKKLDTLAHEDLKEREHFGFADGISQPIMKDLPVGDKVAKTPPTPKEEAHHIMAGEIVLGYLNEYSKTSYTPAIKGYNNIDYDLGLNGTYMVFRQLEQDVKGFWTYMQKEVATNPNLKGKDAVYLASKIVGRWPNGVSLTDSSDPNSPPPQNLNGFLFIEDKDAEGLRCPLGSHIRRTNPRDSIDNDTQTSITISKRHRILRRGRTYGKPLVETMDPNDMMTAEEHGKRGLFFICLNANIKRQFEFIQHVWSNNSKFDGLYNDIDALTGFPHLDNKYVPGEFTIQDCPVRKRVKNIPQFITVRGGGYFFMPSLTALKIIAALRQESLTNCVP